MRTKAEETGATGLKGPMTPHRGVPAPAGRERLAIVSARARCRLRHSLLRTFISVFFNQDISHSLTLSPHPLETPKHWPHPTWGHAAGAEWRRSRLPGSLWSLPPARASPGQREGQMLCTAQAARPVRWRSAQERTQPWCPRPGSIGAQSPLWAARGHSAAGAGTPCSDKETSTHHRQGDPEPG